MDFNELDFNDEFVAVYDALENTRQHLFITGKAGTGKSTLLQYFRQRTEKNIAVLAPTGISAINIKGQTIHSFFQFKPDITPQTVGEIPIRKAKRNMYQKLDAIVIDEVSMVRADLMDCVDAMLRLYGPHFDRPFGGVQMIFFGDLFQLPPVVGRGEEHVFSSVYPTPYFFSARSVVSLDLTIMELKKIYRQKDEQFIHLLNAVRDNVLAAHHISAFNTRYSPTHKTPPGEFYITLTTTNALADKVNAQKIMELPGKLERCHGIVAGEFDRKSLPTTEYLDIKVGAQVMMLNNDAEKRWVNGSLGIVSAIKTENNGEAVIMVDLESGRTVDVKKYDWELYQYYFDEAIESLSSKVVGYFTQYPLKLAWAVTIHKSQGQTFERVIIDIGFGTFSHGQMYVALSRCTTLNGVILKQPLASRNVLLDPRVVHFHKSKVNVPATTKPVPTKTVPSRAEDAGQSAGTVFTLIIAFMLYALCHAAPAFADERDDEVARALVKAQEQQAQGETWEGRNSSEPYVTLISEYETVLNADWSYEETYHTRIKVQQEAGKELSRWPIFYNRIREQIVDIAAYVETPQGQIIPVEKPVEEVPAYKNSPLYQDMLVRVLEMPEVKVGSILNVTVKTKVSSKEIPGQFWDEIPYPPVPTKYSRHTYVFPKDLPLDFKIPPNITPITEEKDGLVKYSFVFEQTAALEIQPMMPPSFTIRPSVYASTIKDWKIIADWFNNLVAQSTIDNDTIKAKALELTKDKATEKDRARAIIEFIQDDYQYAALNFGDHMIEPHKSTAVFQAKYGDSKDLTILTRQMLAAAGIPSNIALMAGEFTQDPVNALPAPSLFEHVVLEMKLDGEKYFVDPQSKGFDFGHFPNGYDNAYVMVLDPAGHRFDHLPITDESDRTLVNESDITVKPDGSGVFQVHVQLPLDASGNFRGEWAASEDKEKFFQNLETTFAQNGTLKSHKVNDVENRYGPITFDLGYEAPLAYPVINDMILIKEAEQSDLPEFAAKERTYPLFMAANALVKNMNVYHIPDGYHVDFIPQNYTLSTGFAEVSVEYATQGNAITVRSTYRMKRSMLPASEYSNVQAFRRDVLGGNEQYIVLKRNPTTGTQAKAWIQNQ